MPPPLLYTVGTWRVSLEAYLEELQRLGVRRVADVRGNPRAGRQRELWRSRELEASLRSAGVSYEYWGKELGEDAFEASSEHGRRCDRAPSIARLAALARRETVCLLGHLHEPQGCHRLRICDALLAAAGGLGVRHLLWRDHRQTHQHLHEEVAASAARVLKFFREHKAKAEDARIRRGSSPGVALPTVEWKDFSPALFADGVARRFVLPFDTELLWHPCWFSRGEADALEKTVREKVTFLHPTYLFQEPSGGCTSTLIKRGQMRICDAAECPGAVAAAPLEPWSRSLMHAVEDAAGVAMNNFVANHYANGRVVINWHSDSGPGDDEGLGPNPSIASISLGAERSFSLKSKRPVNGRMLHLDILLKHGSLLVMGKNSQTHWLHALPADENCRDERINLTFRFYARESTKHVEGVEHNHEWEAAKGSTRVRLHRGSLGRPVLVDIPDPLAVEQLPRYLSAVLPGHRGACSASVRDAGGRWVPLPAGSVAAEACRRAAKDGCTPELQLLPAPGAAAQSQRWGPGATARPLPGASGRGGKGRGRGRHA